ncbi:MAG TPA: TonB-dependent receptor [Bryobacteraceae bacterium]|nr:TonB-dependent receptor [Bryobacteraceae bacterium]
MVSSISTETPADITVLDHSQLQQIPGVVLDDRLRSIPGFSLFRRSSSLVAHPTTQGISLRGIGSSGASRTLVLWDGIPANDPFGGWVYWTQFIPQEMSRIEVSRGDATSVFGDRAMSGTLALFSRPPEARHLLASFEAGNKDTEDATLGYSTIWRDFAFSANARAFSTEGYFVVPSSIRGAVDRTADVRFITTDAHIDHYTTVGNIFINANILAEERQNGTVLTHNSTGLGTVSLRYEREFTNDTLSISGFHTREGFHSTFSSVAANRNTERLTYTQTVPSQALGGAALWQHHESFWHLLAGADVDRLKGFSTDHVFPTGLRQGGGTQLQHGIFAQADAKFGSARFFGGLRQSFTGQDSHFVSPSAGVVLGSRRLRLRGSVYRSFRAPTLNELYRQFSVGNTVTMANAALRPETLNGAEAGIDLVGEKSTFRVTAYRNSLDNLITNVTLSSSPTQIIRQRANAAAAHSRGAEAEFQHRFRHWTADFNYLFVDSRYVTGFRVAQIPKHQGTAQLTYQRGGTLFSLGFRSFDYQFDDDLNTFRLPGYATVELLLRQRLSKSLSADLAFNNVLDRTYYTAFTPTPNIGEPRLWRIGFIWDGKL